MIMGKRVLIIGLQPKLVDFSLPELVNFPGLNAEKIQAGLDADQAELTELGYDVDLCLTDTGETAEEFVRARLEGKPFDCVMIGAGVRTIAQHFLLFEKLINIVHRYAPQAKICFNSQPSDTAEAVRRWV
ncbi:MAG: hypothetical protein ABIP75_19485 [Pyrinomonadaceae bacterium]